MSLVRLLVNSRWLVGKFWEGQSDTWIFNCVGSFFLLLPPVLLKGQLYMCTNTPVSWSGRLGSIWSSRILCSAVLERGSMGRAGLGPWLPSPRLALSWTVRGFIHTVCTYPTSGWPLATPWTWGYTRRWVCPLCRTMDLRKPPRQALAVSSGLFGQETQGSQVHWHTETCLSSYPSAQLILSSSCIVNLTLAMDPFHRPWHTFKLSPTKQTKL